MPVVEIKSMADFKEKIANSQDLVVLDCWAPWCGPCRAISPKIDQYSEVYSQAKFYKVDVDEVPDLAQELGIRAMPTIVYFNKGEKFSEVVGADPRAIEEGVKSLIA
ncbi:thioredoxin trx1 [Penicillium waksmanii]|uniref:thioredoxin trx1 n=1 Tax=Penicillium waksmanii TaxID=69791 RepID=UPI002547BE44|nr:thioredoxin trx1 [Penicillium waksmanii]KAJ5980096.1 thioredoxin trx1 [Penicillium waksmanii]